MIVDRIEGEYAVVELECGKTISVPVELFSEIEEGMIFKVVRDKDLEKERRDEISSLFKKLRP